MRAVLERDFLFEASRPRAFRARTYLGLFVALAVATVLFARYGEIVQAPDVVAASIFHVGAGALVAMLALLTPAAVAGAVLGERIQETLPLVLASPVGPVRVALAKLLSRSAMVLTWGLAALLPLGLTLLLGGVSGAEVLRLAGLAVAVVLDLAAWSLWVSCVSRRPATASILAYLLPGARWAACIVAGAHFGKEGHGAASALLLASTPVPAYLDLADPGTGTALVRSLSLPWTGSWGSGPSVPIGIGLSPVLTALAVSLLLALLSVLLSGRRLRSEGEPRGSRIAASRTGRRLFRSSPPPGNPMAWKEGRLLSTGASRPMYYGVLFVMVAAEIGWVVTTDVREKYVVDMEPTLLFTAFATGLSLVAVLVGSSSISYERTQGTWDLLRASPLTVRQILRGKLGGILRGLGFLAILPVAHLWIALAMGALWETSTALAGTALLGVLLLFWSVVGLLCGALARKPGKAITVAVLVFAAFLIGLPVLHWTFDGLWMRMQAGGGPGVAIGSGSPWGLVSQALTAIEEVPRLERFRDLPSIGYESDWIWREFTLPGLWAAAWAGLLVAASFRILRILEGILSRDRIEERPPADADEGRGSPPARGPAP